MAKKRKKYVPKYPGGGRPIDDDPGGNGGGYYDPYYGWVPEENNKHGVPPLEGGSNAVPGIDYAGLMPLFGQLQAGMEGEKRYRGPDQFNQVKGYYGFNYKKGGPTKKGGDPKIEKSEANRLLKMYLDAQAQIADGQYSNANIDPSTLHQDSPSTLETVFEFIKDPGVALQRRGITPPSDALGIDSGIGSYLTDGLLAAPALMLRDVNQQSLSQAPGGKKYPMGGDVPGGQVPQGGPRGPEERQDLYNNEPENNYPLASFLPFVLEDPRNTVNAGKRKPIAIQAEKGEYISSPYGDIVQVAAKKRHKDMEDDEVTDITSEGNYILSNHKTMSFKKGQKIKGIGMDSLTLGRSPIYYKENEVSTTPKVYKLSDIEPDKSKYTPADVAKRIVKKFPLSTREDDPFATRAQVENKQSRQPYLKALVALSELKKAKPVEQFAMGGAVNPADNSIKFNRFEIPNLDDLYRIPNFAEGGDPAARYETKPDWVDESTPKSSEGTILKAKGDPWEYQKVNGAWKTRKVGSKNWINPTGLALAAIKNRYDKESLTSNEKKLVNNYYSKKTKEEVIPGTVAWNDVAGMPTYNPGSTKGNVPATLPPGKSNMTYGVTDMTMLGSGNSVKASALPSGNSVSPTTISDSPRLNPYAAAGTPATIQRTPQVSQRSQMQPGRSAIEYTATDVHGNVPGQAYENAGIAQAVVATYPSFLIPTMGNAYIQGAKFGLPRAADATWKASKAARAAGAVNKYSNSFFGFQNGGRVPSYPYGGETYDYNDDSSKNRRKQFNSWLDQADSMYQDYYLNDVAQANDQTSAIDAATVLGQKRFEGTNEYLQGNQYFSRLNNLESQQNMSFGSEQAYYENAGNRENSIIRQGLNAGAGVGQLAGMRGQAIAQGNQGIAGMNRERRGYTDKYGANRLVATDTYAGRQNQQKAYETDFENNRLQNLGNIATKNIAGRLAAKAGALGAATQFQLAKTPGNALSDTFKAITDIAALAANIGTALTGFGITGGGGGGGSQGNGQQVDGTYRYTGPNGPSSVGSYGRDQPWAPGMYGTPYNAFNAPIRADNENDWYKYEGGE